MKPTELADHGDLVPFDPANPNYAQQVLIDLYGSLPASTPQAITDSIRMVRESLPLDSLTFAILSNPEFHHYLVNIKKEGA